MSTSTITRPALGARVDGLAWDTLREQLDTRGYAVTAPLLTEPECEDLSDLFDGGRFRSTIDMARHRFGDGRYRYFDHPLPDAIGELRGTFVAADGALTGYRGGLQRKRALLDLEGQLALL